MKEKIIEVLKNVNKGSTPIEINDMLNLKEVAEYKKLQEELNILVSDGILHCSKKGKYILMEYCTSLLNGIIHINKSGNGFVDTKNIEDTFVAKENLNGAVDGDFVEIDIRNSFKK